MEDMKKMMMGQQVLLTLVGAVASTLAVHQLWRRRQRCARAARVAGHTKINLLPSECSPVICMSPATSTVTFFRGSPKSAAKYLSKRVAAIVAANPWLASVLDYDPETGAMAAFCPTAVGSQRFFAVQEGIQLSRAVGGATAYDAMVRVLAPILCKTSNEAVGTGAPLFSVTMLPDPAAPDRFALVVSANHSLLDGHGFYAVHNMLSSDATVVALRPERKQGLPAKIVKAMGGEKSLMAECPPGFLARFVSGQLRAALFPQTKAMSFYLSAEWVAAQKKKAAAEADAAVPWVSTNDCVVSAFCNLLRPDVALMAANFRGKVKGCSDKDVGNYEDLIEYMPADYATPMLLRKSVNGPPFCRAAVPATRPLSSWQHLWGATYGAATNWSSFAKPLTLGAGEEQELHLPLFDWPKACPACIFGSIVLFRPVAGQVAAMVAGKKALIDKIRASGMVGKLLDIEMV